MQCAKYVLIKIIMLILLQLTFNNVFIRDFVFGKNKFKSNLVTTKYYNYKITKKKF